PVEATPTRAQIGLSAYPPHNQPGHNQTEANTTPDLVIHPKSLVLGHAGVEERAVDDELAAPLEQVGQARPALGSVELIILVHRQQRHPPALRSQRVPGVGQLFLLYEKLLARGLPLSRRDDWGCFHCGVHLSYGECPWVSYSGVVVGPWACWSSRS